MSLSRIARALITEARHIQNFNQVELKLEVLGYDLLRN